MYPILRFSISEERKLSTEYIGRADGNFAGKFRDAPVAKGRMIVDCSDLLRIGLALEPVGIGSWIYGANRKYRFRWTHSEYPGDSIRRMRFDRNRRTGQIEDWFGFDEKRARWLVNGVVTVTVTVTKQVRFKTEFELQNCDANKFRSRIPPSDQFSALQPETARRIQFGID